MNFKLKKIYEPSGDQPQAIGKLTAGLKSGLHDQVLLGVTGSGKTFTMANIIEKLNRPALVISHNKTLAAQLFQEFRDYFPDNAVSYFVSYYDYYQPEAYLPQTDTYIEKETDINREIDKLRLAATTNILTRKDTIVVASVSAIYNIGSPKEYGQFVMELSNGVKIRRKEISRRLIQLQYVRNDYAFERGSFRMRGDAIDIFPAYTDFAVRLIFQEDLISGIQEFDPLTGNVMADIEYVVIYPAKHYMTDPKTHMEVFREIKNDLEKQVDFFKSSNKLIEAQRISQRVNYDLEMIAEMGYVNGIENYSRYFDRRNPGSPPYTLFDYFNESYGSKKSDQGWLLFIDESHMTIPQIRGMYNGDRTRKQTLVDFGFRLPAAMDNRPLRFDEFLRVMPQTVYVSATPADWEIQRAKSTAAETDQTLNPVVEQLIRPTGLTDPEVIIRPVKNQIDDVIFEILKRISGKERVLVTTLTKRMSEDLAKFLEEKKIKVHFLHSDVETLERTDILADLRLGKYDVVVGVNLLREGLDLPEVSLVAILDADKEGFLRSRTSLIQTMGRAARHQSGKVIMYADKITNSIKEAVAEVERRRKIQSDFNQKHRITPRGINKPVRKQLVEKDRTAENRNLQEIKSLSEKEIDSLTPGDKKKKISYYRRMMAKASKDLNFEDAMFYRDEIERLK